MGFERKYCPKCNGKLNWNKTCKKCGWNYHIEQNKQQKLNI